MRLIIGILLVLAGSAAGTAQMLRDQPAAPRDSELASRLETSNSKGATAPYGGAVDVASAVTFDKADVKSDAPTSVRPSLVTSEKHTVQESPTKTVKRRQIRSNSYGSAAYDWLTFVGVGF